MYLLAKECGIAALGECLWTYTKMKMKKALRCTLLLCHIGFIRTTGLSERTVTEWCS